MYKATTKLFISVFAVFFALTLNSNAQLEQGSLGVGASFVSSSPMAEIHYVLQSNIDVGIGLSYNSTSTDQQIDLENKTDESSFTVEGFIKYFLKKGKDVSPYVGGALLYSSGPNDESSVLTYTRSAFGLGVFFGGQVFLAKQFAVFGQVGLSYISHTTTQDKKSDNKDLTDTQTNLTIGGSGVGAIFYFDL